MLSKLFNVSVEHWMTIYSIHGAVLSKYYANLAAQSLLAVAAGSALPWPEGQVCHSPLQLLQLLAVLDQGLIKATSLNKEAPSRRSDPLSICSNPSNSAKIDFVFE